MLIKHEIRECQEENVNRGKPDAKPVSFQNPAKLFRAAVGRCKNGQCLAKTDHDEHKKSEDFIHRNIPADDFAAIGINEYLQS